MHDRYDWSAGGSVQADFPILKDQLYATLNGGLKHKIMKTNFFENIASLRITVVKRLNRFLSVITIFIP
jgi:hypothetical protein